MSVGSVRTVRCGPHTTPQWGWSWSLISVDQEYKISIFYSINDGQLSSFSILIIILSASKMNQKFCQFCKKIWRTLLPGLHPNSNLWWRAQRFWLMLKYVEHSIIDSSYVKRTSCLFATLMVYDWTKCIVIHLKYKMYSIWVPEYGHFRGI